jgi:DNA sulfur modification protein DndB
MEQVSPIFVAHELTQPGLERTRRLFTTLNRYAKPVSQRDLIAQDEDDVVAIVVRRLIDGEPLLRERISDAIGTSLPQGDNVSVTTLPALYEAMDRILRNRSPKDWAAFKRLRPNERDIQELLRIARAFWHELTRRVPVLRALSQSTDRRVSAPDRGDAGGHLLLRPVGLTSFARATRFVLEDGVELGPAIAQLASLPMELGAPPWVKMLWNPTSKRMITAKENKDVAVAWLALAGGAQERRTLSLRHLEVELNALDEEIAPAALELLHRNRPGSTIGRHGAK